MYLPSTWELPETIINRFGTNSAGKQRAMFHDSHLLLVLHQAPKKGQEAGNAVFFWRTPENDWRFSGRGSGKRALQEHVDRYEQREDELQNLFTKSQLAEDYFQLLGQIAPVLRAVRNLHTTLQAARESLKRDKDIIRLRDQAYEIERGLELLHQDSQNALDFSMAQKSEELTRLSQHSLRAGQRLNTLAAVFFPLTAVAGLLGMNLPTGMEKMPIWFFWGVVTLGVIAGLLLSRWANAQNDPETDEQQMKTDLEAN